MIKSYLYKVFYFNYLNSKMSKVKILMLGPKRAGKSTIANILGDL